MKEQHKILFPLKLIFIILSSLFLFASCNKRDVEKPENVCTLTPEQLPELRGFRLGISYDAIKERFPRLCSATKDTKFQFGKLYPTYKYDSWVQFYTYPSTGYNPPDALSKCEFVAIENHPELAGIGAVEIAFEKGVARRIYIEYEKNNDKEFWNTFRLKTQELLGLREFTNWNTVSDISGDKKIDGREMLCNKLDIQIGNLNYPQYSNYFPYLIIEDSEKIAITKAQQAQERQAAEVQKKAEDQKKRETFKP